jgi:predicted DNA-binding transcriptional regulator AlpA
MPSEHVTPARWPRLLSIEQFGEYASVSTRTIEKWKTLGILPATVKLPGGERLTRWDREDVDTFLANLPKGSN